VSSDLFDLCGVKTQLEEPAGGFVPEVVKGEVDQKGRIGILLLLVAFLFIDSAGSGDSTFERPGNRLVF
jgi:hypothetical protein